MKKLSVKLNDAMQKKNHADQSWERTYQSLEEKIDIQRLYLSMHMCDMADTILLNEENLGRQRKILRINVDEYSLENVQLDLERSTKLRFVEELIKLKEPYVTAIYTKK